MQDLIRETVFGHIVHAASGGKLFAPPEQRDPSLLQKYMITKSSASASGDSLNPFAETPASEKSDPEKGGDHQLVDWTENDSEVWNYFVGPRGGY